MNRYDENLPDETRPVRRSDWRSAFLWVSRSRGRARFVVLLLAVAGLCSALGLLRWQGDVARWSFAALCWSVAAVVVLNSQRREFLPGERDLTRCGR
jgi:hypothetical protein